MTEAVLSALVSVLMAGSAFAASEFRIAHPAIAKTSPSCSRRLPSIGGVEQNPVRGEDLRRPGVDGCCDGRSCPKT